MLRYLVSGWLCVAAFAVVIWADTVVAQEEPENEPERVTPQQSLEHMQRFEMRSARGEEAIELVEKPLLAFGDSARANKNGSLWAFGPSGRPRAILELYQPEGDAKSWVHAVSLTSSTPVVLDTPGMIDWSPASSQLAWQKFSEAAAPAAKPAQRMRQMKDLARRFAAHEFWDPDNTRSELRLLVQPVHRYDSPATGIQDGAVFVLAHGTNPEVLVLLEAVGKTVDEAQWNYAFARLGSAEMHVALDGEEVWTTGRAVGITGEPTDPYWLFFTLPSDEAP